MRMGSPRPLPPALGPFFSVRQAEAAGVDRERLRRGDLETPFRGARDARKPRDLDRLDPFEKQAASRRIREQQYLPLLKPGQFLSHESAVALIGGPLPIVARRREIVDGMTLPVHVSTLGTGPLARTRGVVAHRANPENTSLARWKGHALASPASAWAQCASWSLIDIVALG